MFLITWSKQMTQDEIIEMAKEAGLDVDDVFFSDRMYREVLMRFAHLVAAKATAKERETLAQEQKAVGYWKENAQGLQRDYDLLLADYEKFAQQEQEPVAWEQLHEHIAGPFYTHPPQRTWVGLSDEEVRDLWSWSATSEAEKTANTQQHAFARAIEAKLKEKNNA